MHENSRQEGRSDLSAALKPPMQRNILIHVVDDDEAVRRSLAFLLSSAGFAVRLYHSATALLDSVAFLQPGCILSDIRMPEVDGLELQRRLRALGVRLPLILMTGNADIPLAVEAMKAGAVDFIEKPFKDDVLLASIELAARHLDELAQEDAKASQVAVRLSALTPREKQVLDGLLAGQSNKVIAKNLQLSPRTVEVHRASVMHKMNAGSLTELVLMAVRANRPEVK
jgi:two-component system response regulator FixJ